MKELQQALLNAQKSVSNVGKDAKNSFANYDYVSAEAMIISCRKALHKSGLSFARTNWEMRNSEIGLTVFSKYVLTHAESGEQIEMVNEMIVPPNQKQLDKAVLAALTTGLNYTLRDMLMIPRCENDQPEIDTMPAPKAAPKPAPKPAPKAATKSAVDDGALQAGLAIVFGMKDNAAEYEGALLGHACKKYDRVFNSADELPDEYIKQVLDAHDVNYREATPGETKDIFGEQV
tara:strand:- start:4935 stop:5633 length:699 start_codon:yes stop_codon:yes gene_type:complete